MRKIILLLVLLCSISITAFSADINLNDKARYEKLCDDLTSNTYIDKTSIKVLRDEYPFYVIQGDMITQDFDNDSNILRRTVKYFYDKRNKNIQYQCVYYVHYDKNGYIIDKWLAYDKSLQDVDYSVDTYLGCLRFFVLGFGRGLWP